LRQDVRSIVDRVERRSQQHKVPPELGA
jgi:hypothetical protein